MNKLLLCSALIILSACASTPQSSGSQWEAIPFHKIQQKLEEFKVQDGQMDLSVNGEFKEIYVVTASNTNFVCTGTNTAKYIRYMIVNTKDDGSVSAKKTFSGCDQDFSKALKGIQTKSHVYLYEEENLEYITSYKIDPSSGRLIDEGHYILKNDLLVFEKAKKNNSENQAGNRFYRTAYLPKELWTKLDDFEQIIDRNEQKKITHIKHKQEGFDWGKALALGAGAVAGGGLSLDSETQAGVIAGIVLDSQADTSGTSNLDNAVQSSLETNARRAASNSGVEQDKTQNSTSFEVEPTPKQSVGTTTQTPNAVSTSNSAGNSRKCGNSSYSLAEEQAEKDRLGAIMESKLVNVPAYDYKTRNQLWRDWETGMSAWRKARHEACGINTGRSSRVTIE